MSKIFVIAGNKYQAEDWIKKNLEKRAMSGETTLSRSEYVFVDDASRLRGYRDPRGVFIGTWRERWDIREVVETLLTQSIHVNPTLGKIWGEVKDRVKPTPKLKRVTGGWINEELAIQEAANLLAREIDEEVMKTVMKKINGGNLGTI